MTNFAFLFNLFASAFNATVYAADGHALSLGCAVATGIMAIRLGARA